MEYKVTDGHLELRRTAEEKEPVLKRLRRIEGQVRGVQQMVEDDRHCMEEVQQMNAITAAVREVAVALIGDHLRAGIDFAVRARDGEEVMGELLTVLRAALRQA